jgi:exopolysaccharide production protein ExoY
VGVRIDELNRFSNVGVGVFENDQTSDDRQPRLAAAVAEIRGAGVIHLPALIRKASLPVGGKQKRLLDAVIAAIALILLAPLLLILAAATKLNMGGPVLYRHRRIGFNGVPFDCLKFRTMVAHSDVAFQDYLDRNPAAAEQWRRTRKLANDPRVTRLGYLLRKTSLDELPQLFNVLRGEMSLVGPRPVVSQELELYGALMNDYVRARPGVTGKWQVSGRSSLSFNQRIAMDSAYVREWTLSKDVVIMMQTVPAIFRTVHAA